MIRLSDVVGASGLAGYAIAALILFIVAFLFVLIPIVAPARSAFYERASRMPLDDDTSPAPRAPEHS
jgi:hypothetical protein